MADLDSTIAQEMEERPPANQAHLKYRPDIDGLRAIAVLPVIFYHYSLGFPGGYVGVDVFYVISGFLITKIIYDLVVKRSFSFVDFYDRRVRRLFPALFVTLAATTVWACARMIWFDLSDYGRSLLAATVYCSNIYFYITTGYFVQAAVTKPLLHTWSLAVEEQFYIVVPFVLFALARFTPKRWHVPLLLALSLLSLGLCIALTRIDTPAAFYLLPPRAWELGLGAMLAIGAPAIWRHRWLAECLSLAGVFLILFAAFAFSDATPFPGWRALVPTLGAAAVLSTGGRSGASIERLLGTRPFTFVGKISYSLYLWHWPVIVALTYGGTPSVAKATAGLAITFVISTLSWRFVEMPFRKRQLLATAKQLCAAAAAASLAAILVGAALHFAQGFPHPRSLVRLVHPPGSSMLRPDCHGISLRKVAANRLCVRGAADAKPSFILVGDSHAGALSDGLFAAARSRGVAGVQFTAAGFVPLPGRHSMTSRQTLLGQDTDAFTGAFLAYLKQHPDLKTVVLAGFWVREATGRSYRDPQEIDVDDQYDGSGAAYAPVAFHHALDRLVGEFPDRQFVILDDVPSGSQLDVEEYARALYSGRTPPASLPRSLADRQRLAYEPILREIAAKHRNVRYLPLLKRLCGPASCPLFRSDGTLIYRNGDHLSRHGSLGLAPALATVFDGLSSPSRASAVQPRPTNMKAAAPTTQANAPR